MSAVLPIINRISAIALNLLERHFFLLLANLMMGALVLFILKEASPLGALRLNSFLLLIWGISAHLLMEAGGQAQAVAAPNKTLT